MSKGFWVGDALASGLEIAAMNASRAAADNRTSDLLDRMTATIKELRSAEEYLIDCNSGNLAEKHALRVALAKLAPDHPLLADQALREKLHSTATRVYYINKNWEDVTRYGQKFEY